MGRAGADSSRAARRLTAIFAKRPAPGRVKTRLTPPLEPGEAAALAEAMLADAVERCTASAGFRTAIAFAPPEEEAWFRARHPAVPLRAQRGRDLSERLARFFDEALGAEAETVVAIGADQPLVTAARIVEAHRALEDGADVALGPDLAGGYYLVGLRRPCAALFTGVAMSSTSTLAATREVARSAGLAVRELAPSLDVDVAEDLVRLCEELARVRASGGAAGPDFPRRTEARLRALPLSRP
jgi:hypothetical protein